MRVLAKDAHHVEALKRIRDQVLAEVWAETAALLDKALDRVRGKLGVKDEVPPATVETRPGITIVHQTTATSGHASLAAESRRKVIAERAAAQPSAPEPPPAPAPPPAAPAPGLAAAVAVMRTTIAAEIEQLRRQSARDGVWDILNAPHGVVKLAHLSRTKGKHGQYYTQIVSRIQRRSERFPATVAALEARFEGVDLEDLIKCTRCELRGHVVEDCDLPSDAEDAERQLAERQRGRAA